MSDKAISILCSYSTAHKYFFAARYSSLNGISNYKEKLIPNKYW